MPFIFNRFLIVFCQPLFKKLCYMRKPMHNISNCLVVISSISLHQEHETGNRKATATVAIFQTLTTDNLVLNQQHNNPSFKVYSKVLYNCNWNLAQIKGNSHFEKT